ncbi:putative LPS assembly protein LptD [Flavobacteriaceae bacterium]|nr:putative LPS assembly protein LptD [Flavobacteriaceae bacterium]MDC3242196.1 putative LPS assembly protein LptD [Flavobacteriaceae bacterium]
MFCSAQDIPKRTKSVKPLVTVDTLKIPQDSLQRISKLTKERDSITRDTVPKKKGMIESLVKYTASEYVSFDRAEQKTYLYNNAKVTYMDMEITAGIIVINHENNEVYAGRLKDTLGNYSQAPVFKQGSDVIEPDSIRFNFNSEKALIWNSRTEQSGGYIKSEKTKKENDSVYFINRGKFTTSADPENPEYYFLMRNAKVVPGKKVVTGLTNMFIADVPTPIGLPFAYFPLTKKQTSGVIFPSFGEDNQRGYNIQNGGYYFAISDYADLAVTGDYYTNGSYGLRVQSSYAVRYKFRGNLSFRFENLITSERGFPDYANSSIYNLRWSHNQDSKSNPNSRFSASVNLGSSRYYQQSINQVNASNFLNNTLSSSISYSKTFQGEPQVNLNMTATHSQNTQTQVINMTLPTFQGSVSRVYPFAPKNGSKKGLIQNINMQYNVRGENRIQTTDSLFFKKEMFDDAKIGMKHSIPLTTNFKLFKYLSLSAGGTYEENWTLNTVNKTFDQATQEVITTDLNNFDSFRTYNLSASLGTTVYGMFDFGEDSKIQAIRHVMRPSISYNISPAFDQYYETYEVIDANGLTSDEVEYTRFENSIFGSPNRNLSSSIGLSLGNNFEAKVRDKDSTATEPKKIILLNNLNFSTAYNIAADSLGWSPVRMSGGTQLLNNKMRINFGATLDPYALDNNNKKINEFNIANGGSLFRLTSANLTLNYSLSSQMFGGKESKNNSQNNRAREESIQSGGRADDLFGKPQDFSNRQLETTSASTDEDEEKPSELYNYKVPWDLNLAYAVNYTNTARQNEISSHSLMFSGNVDLSPRWTVGASSGYDLKNKGITYTQLRFERDLLSWKLNFSWIPFSTRSSWNFFIGIKSGILKDIKYEQRRQRDRQL